MILDCSSTEHCSSSSSTPRRVHTLLVSAAVYYLYRHAYKHIIVHSITWVTISCYTLSGANRLNDADICTRILQYDIPEVVFDIHTCILCDVTMRWWLILVWRNLYLCDADMSYPSSFDNVTKVTRMNTAQHISEISISLNLFTRVNIEQNVAPTMLSSGDPS